MKNTHTKTFWAYATPRGEFLAKVRAAAPGDYFGGKEILAMTGVVVYDDLRRLLSAPDRETLELWHGDSAREWRERWPAAADTPRPARVTVTTEIEIDGEAGDGTASQR